MSVLHVPVFVSLGTEPRHDTCLAGVSGIKAAPVPKPKPAEDIPGVPTAAWARVKRGVPASDPFKPGEGFMLMVDGARFLPGMLSCPTAYHSISPVPL